MAKGGEIIAWNESEDNVREEVNRRTYKAGHTNRDGGPPSATKIMVVGGLGKSKLNIWPRDENGDLIE